MRAVEDAGGHDPVIAALIRQIARIRQGAVDPARLSADTPLWDGLDAEDRGGQHAVGLDSLDFLELLVAMEGELGVRMPDEADASTCRTIRDVADLLARQPRL